MKLFTNRRVTKKIVIVILTVLMLTFTIPKPVNADIGGILVSPLTALITVVADTGQWVLEWLMLGRPNYFMDQMIDFAPTSATPANEATITVKNKIDGTIFLDATNVPDIQYTPEAIFSNRVPALDINFIKPSVRAADDATEKEKEKIKEKNVAVQLQPTLASWYVAIRTLALVGLLSVLVYLGIRMLLTGVAADKAKYKKMLMDWLVAVCLLFVLHYIMSFALTMSEVVTSMISPSTEGTVAVYVEQEGKVFDMTLMNYVRFMMQSTDFKEKIAFLGLYIMLVIFTWKFTWTYLKRVVNMAFLTLIAPLVALTYPIDKVSDGKAQAFNMWIKEFAYNALLQPLHLLLYTVLLGAATELAADNPLYAIVCLAFIIAGEKLFKKMFGFDKAGAGTVGSLAGALGVSNLASKALMGLAKGPHGGKGGPQGKVRTNTDRDGRNTGANKGYNTFDKNENQGLPELNDTGNQGSSATSPDGSGSQGNPVPPPNGGGNEENPMPLDGENDNEPPKLTDEEEEELRDRSERLDREWSDEYESSQNKEDQDRIKELTEKRNKRKEWEDQQKEQQATQEQTDPDPQGSPEVKQAMQNLGPEVNDEPETWRTLRDKDRQQAYEAKKQKRLDKVEANRQKRLDKESGELSRKRKIAAYKTIKGIGAGARTAGYRAVRGTAKTALRVAAGASLAAVAGVIGATTGDGEKALAAAGTAFAVGAGTGGRIFEGTIGKVAQDKSVKDSYGAAKYGSAIEARNIKSDKEYLRSQEHKEEYEKYFATGKNRMSKQEYDRAVREYREAGITDKKKIRNALKLEQQYREDKTRNHGSDKDIRGKVQNIVQTYDNIDRKAVYGSDSKATEAALKNIENQLTSGDAKQKRAIANEILQGYRDWYNV